MWERAEEFGVPYGAQNRAVPGLHSVPGPEFGGKCGERKMAVAPALGTAGGALRVKAGLPAEAKTSWPQSLAGQAEATCCFTQFPIPPPCEKADSCMVPYKQNRTNKKHFQTRG